RRGLSLACNVFAKRGLRRSKPRDRHTEGGAGHVIEVGLVTERDGGRVAAVLATDADFEVAPHVASSFDPDPHQFTDALLVDRYKRVSGQNAPLRVHAEKARGVVTR